MENGCGSRKGTPFMKVTAIIKKLSMVAVTRTEKVNGEVEREKGTIAAIHHCLRSYYVMVWGSKLGR